MLFQSPIGNNKECMRAYVGANEGDLYLLSNGILFFKKPLIFIPLDEIDTVTNARNIASTRTLDLLIITVDEDRYEFNMIDKGNEQEIAVYLKYILKQRKKKKKKLRRRTKRRTRRIR